MQAPRTSRQVYPDNELAVAAAALFVQVAEEATHNRGRFTVALAGGSTPRPLYELLATPPYRDRIDWSVTHLFWGDERTVPPDHEDSNYRMVAKSLLAGIEIPWENVHRIEGERPPQDAADVYEAMLREHFDLRVGEYPRFDFVLLGLGSDGHTASLFPDLDELHERNRLVVAPYVPIFDAHRISLTVPVINAARTVCFLVSGAMKANAVHAVLEGEHDPSRWPAQYVQPHEGQLVWLLDEAAASRLTR